MRRLKKIASIAVSAVVVSAVLIDAPAHADGPTVTPGPGGFNVTVDGSTGGSPGGSAPSSPAGPTASGGPGLSANTPSGPSFTELVVASGRDAACTAVLGSCLEAVPGEQQGPVPVTPSFVDIATAVQVALTGANIRPIDIGIVPEDEPGRTGLVGNPTWMWVKNPSENTIGPVQRTATTGAVTVNLTGTLTSVV